MQGSEQENLIHIIVIIVFEVPVIPITPGFRWQLDSIMSIGSAMIWLGWSILGCLHGFRVVVAMQGPVVPKYVNCGLFLLEIEVTEENVLDNQRS
jgi:hypothetical protein